jgi:putative hydrolase of the HAD superfamily
MIQNIVFDMAWVLFSYEPTKFIREHVSDEGDAELIHRELFCADEWLETDRGALNDEEYLSIVLPRLPERLWDVSRWLFGHWHEMPQPIGGMEQLVRELKENGYRLYLLTNMSKRFYSFYQNIPAVEHFDDLIVSADEHCIKPEPEFFHILFERFALKPEECFFIDDRGENIAAGQALGMEGFCFRQDVGALRTALREAGVKISKDRNG